jgi:hypothetical protein
MKTDLTRAQVRALFLVASKSRGGSVQPYADLLEAAATETTPVAELVRIKDLAKGYLEDAADRRHRDAATLLYHVAVAAAFIHHDALISGRPMRKQRAVYEQLAAAWEGRPIGRIFREAAARVAAEGTGE